MTIEQDLIERGSISDVRFIRGAARYKKIRWWRKLLMRLLGRTHVRFERKPWPVE